LWAGECGWDQSPVEGTGIIWIRGWHSSAGGQPSNRTPPPAFLPLFYTIPCHSAFPATVRSLSECCCYFMMRLISMYVCLSGELGCCDHGLTTRCRLSCRQSLLRSSRQLSDNDVVSRIIEHCGHVHSAVSIHGPHTTLPRHTGIAKELNLKPDKFFVGKPHLRTTECHCVSGCSSLGWPHLSVFGGEFRMT